MSPLATTRESRKRVRISEDAPRVSVDENELSEEEYKESWWTASEFAALKASTKRLCQIYRRAQKYSDYLTEAYHTACYLAQTDDDELDPKADGDSSSSSSSSSSLVSTSVDEPCTKVSVVPDKGLQQWVLGRGPRGLEGYSSRLHAMRRQRHVLETKRAVFIEQARQSAYNARDSELLAKHAATASRRARTFAVLLGHADAWIVNNDDADSESEPRDVLDALKECSAGDSTAAATAAAPRCAAEIAGIHVVATRHCDQSQTYALPSVEAASR